MTTTLERPAVTRKSSYAEKLITAEEAAARSRRAA